MQSNFDETLSVGDTITVLQAYDAIVEFFYAFGPPFYGFIFVASEPHYDSFTTQGRPYNDCRTWSVWSDAVRHAVAVPELQRTGRDPGTDRAEGQEAALPPFAVSHEVSMLEAYDGAIRLMEGYKFVGDVSEILPSFRYTEVVSGRPNSGFGWHAFLVCLWTRLNAPEDDWRHRRYGPVTS